MWKELVPQERLPILESDDDLWGDSNLITCGYNQALTDHQPLYDYIEKCEAELSQVKGFAIKCKEEMSVAKAEVKRLEAERNELKNIVDKISLEVYNHIIEDNKALKGEGK